ncbi:hypothetical protein CDL12_14881 [Handroanthus impetiginosus]|uniref:Non-specific serine/threonine protein kinase n=1 Tax=Handroanthus impetiginosus TaxID=429701 RepID=A0A2G9H5A8_9LAMI|nr:hypothetical protein CDL12_14881 [Handroanthus impetiginosus]
MSKIKSLRYLGFLSLSFALVLVPGLADKSSPSGSAPNEGRKAVKSMGSSSTQVLEIIIICIGVLGAVAISVLLFKLWQRKKREERQARLLKLFEEDDQLEQELGI